MCEFLSVEIQHFRVDLAFCTCVSQAFELLVGRWLFHPEKGDEWTVEDDHLAKMMELTGQSKFPESMLGRAKRRDEFFDDDGPSELPRPVATNRAIHADTHCVCRESAANYGPRTGQSRDRNGELQGAWSLAGRDQRCGRFHSHLFEARLHGAGNSTGAQRPLFPSQCIEVLESLRFLCSRWWRRSLSIQLSGRRSV